MTTMDFAVVGANGREKLFSIDQRWLSRLLRPSVWFFGLVSFIAIVSVHDAGLLVVNQEAILEFEQNPIGAWLIHINNGSVWLFVALKLFGTSVVCAVLASIYEYSKSLAMIVVSPLATFQAVLLGYLYGA